MSTALYELQETNPLRLPNWRLQRARDLLKRPDVLLNRLVDDEATERCVVYLRATAVLAQCPKVFRAHAPVSYAVELHSNEVYRPLRQEVEARILAGQSDSDIAAATGLSPEAVRAYENICYQIRDRLSAVDYILLNVVGLQVGLGIESLNQSQQLLYLAYIGGPRIVDLLLFSQRSLGANRAKVLQMLAQATVEHFATIEESRLERKHILKVVAKFIGLLEDGELMLKAA